METSSFSKPRIIKHLGDIKEVKFELNNAPEGSYTCTIKNVKSVNKVFIKSAESRSSWTSWSKWYY